MKNASKFKWNKHYKENERTIVNHNNWLSDYNNLFSSNEKILELGCGFGFNSIYLKSLGHNIIATDFSPEVLIKLKCINQEIEISELDLRKKMQINDNTFDSVVADLCLHYFNNKKTRQIISEIQRILKDNGKLFCRINSIFDTNHGAGEGIEIENNYFYNNGIYKQFFTEESVRDYFGNMDIISIKNYEIDRYEKSKNVYEVICYNKKNLHASI